MSWAENAAWLSCCTGRSYSPADAQALHDEPWFQEVLQSRGGEWLKQAFTKFGWVLSAPFSRVQKEARRQWEASQERESRIAEDRLGDEIELRFGQDARIKFMEEVGFRLGLLEDARQVDPHDRGEFGEQLAKRTAAFVEAKNVAIAWKLQREEEVREARKNEAQLRQESEAAYNALLVGDITDALGQLQDRLRDACQHGRVDDVNYIARLLDEVMLSAGGQARQQQLAQWRARFELPVLFQQQWPSPGLQGVSTELLAYVGTEATTIFTAAQIQMESAGATGPLTDTMLLEAQRAFQQCMSATKQKVDRGGNWYVDLRAAVSHEQLDLMLKASHCCRTTEDIRRMRLHDMINEHEQMFDDVIGIIQRGDARVVCGALCPLKKAAANCTDAVSQSSNSTKAMKILFEGAEIINFSEHCFRTVDGPKETEACCSKFQTHTDGGFAKRVKEYQIKMNLLRSCCPRPPEVIGAMSKVPFQALSYLILSPSVRVALEILPGHSTHLSGTFSYVSGSPEERRVAVSLMKQKAQYTASSMAMLGFYLRKYIAMTAEARAALPKPKLLPKPDTGTRSDAVLRAPIPSRLQASPDELVERVTVLCSTVPVVIRGPDDHGCMSVEDAEAEFSKIQARNGRKGGRADKSAKGTEDLGDRISPVTGLLHSIRPTGGSHSGSGMARTLKNRAKAEGTGGGPFTDFMNAHPDLISSKNAAYKTETWESVQKEMTLPPPGYVEPDPRTSSHADIIAAITSAQEYWIPAFAEEPADNEDAPP